VVIVDAMRDPNWVLADSNAMNSTVKLTDQSNRYKKIKSEGDSQ